MKQETRNNAIKHESTFLIILKFASEFTTLASDMFVCEAHSLFFYLKKKMKYTYRFTKALSLIPMRFFPSFCSFVRFFCASLLFHSCGSIHIVGILLSSQLLRQCNSALEIMFYCFQTATLRWNKIIIKQLTNPSISLFWSLFFVDTCRVIFLLFANQLYIADCRCQAEAYNFLRIFNYTRVE